MNAPLSLFLTRFPTSSPQDLAAAPAMPEAMIVMSQAELAAKLESATTAIRLELNARHAGEIATRDAAQAENAAQAFAAARADWANAEGEALGARLAAGLDQLRTGLGERIEAVLRPFLAEVLLTRATAELRDVLARLLADAGAPAIKVGGPQDLIEALQASCPAPGIEWIVGEGIDVTIRTDATRIETRLAAALRALEPTES